MRHVLVRAALASAIVSGCLAASAALWYPPAHAAKTDGATQPTSAGERTVYIGCGLSDEQIIVLGSAVSAASESAVLLLDSPESRPYQKRFLDAYRPTKLTVIGAGAQSTDSQTKYGRDNDESRLEWRRGPPIDLWRSIWSSADRVVVCRPEPRSQLLQAASLAGVLHAPLFVDHGVPEEFAELRDWTAKWNSRELILVGAATERFPKFGDMLITKLTDEIAVAAKHRHHLSEKGAVQTLVVANPADTTDSMSPMSALAPWVALQRKAALHFTNARGDDATESIRTAVAIPGLATVENLILLADLQAIPTEKRPNPVPGKDPFIEMEPTIPHGAEPFSFAIGRLFHRDPAVVTLMLARQKLIPPSGETRKALVVSNPGGSLPLLETFSRHTSKEFRNNGYETTALFDDATPEVVRDLVQQSDIFLWEGHHRTLTEHFGMIRWNEPLPPSLIFLQSCLALDEEETRGLFERGVVALVGSATRTYSATGGAFTLAFFDAMLYDRRTLGGSLRQAKNFLLCYTMLKEKRLGDKARLTGANVRSSWAFTLWGDPMLHLPPPEPPAGALKGVIHSVRGNTITLTQPAKSYDSVEVDRYTAKFVPNARLAGLLTPEGEDMKRLVPFLFAEVPLPNGPAGKTPILSSRLPDRNFVSLWDGRRRCVYLLAIPRSRDASHVRFHVTWR